MIRVIVAEDSMTVRARIVQVLASAPGIEVVGEAPDGKRAIELCQTLRPDVITLDMMMPVLTGLAATEYIMAFCPTPIVIVSGSTNRGEVFRTYEALAAGALDVLEKPGPFDSEEEWGRKLIDVVRVASRVRVITHPRGRLRAWDLSTPADPARREARMDPGARTRVIAMGGSTGGPKAMVEILQTLPARFSLPILIVTHISEPFASGLADWLGDNSPVPVRLAASGDLLRQPGVAVSPASGHLIIEGERLRVIDAPPRHSCRPSVDVLFESAARELGSRGIGVLLTGMGRDGADGLLRMRRAGATTIAQDEASSAIFGMPGEAVKLGAAEHILPPASIGALLRGLAESERRA